LTSEQCEMKGRNVVTSQNIVVLGAGVGGLVVGNELRQKLPSGHRITVVEKNRQHAFAPSFLWLMTGDRHPQEITRSVRSLLRPNVGFVQAEALYIDLSAQRVETTTETLPFDYLVIATGAEFAPDAIPGLSEAALTFYTFDGSIKLWDTTGGFERGTVAVVVSAMPYKCPGAPHEGAMLLTDYFRRRGLRQEIELHLFTPEPQPLPVAGPQLGEAVRQLLEAKGIGFHPLHKLTGVNAESCQLLFDGKEPVRYDLLVAIPPHRGPALLTKSGLANEAGLLPVDRATLSTEQANVYAIGDVTTIPMPGRWKPEVPLILPKAGVFAHGQALVVAHRIAAEITGTAFEEAFCAEGYCMLEAGEDLAGFAFGNFFAKPSPDVRLRNVGRAWHIRKVLFEQWWLAPFGIRREILGTAIKLAAKLTGFRQCCSTSATGAQFGVREWQPGNTETTREVYETHPRPQRLQLDYSGSSRSAFASYTQAA
jgi:sulfide:quinone oxidoreductase